MADAANGVVDDGKGRPGRAGFRNELAARGPHSLVRLARAGLPDPLTSLFAASRPRPGVRISLASALLLLALAALAPAGPAQVQAITGLTVPSYQIEGLRVTWDAYAGASTYTVRWKSAGNIYASTNQQRSLPSASTTITGLTPGTEYTVAAAVHDRR